MPDEYMDPSGNTAQFQAFATEAEPSGAAKHTGVIVAGAVLAVVALALIIWAFI